MRIKILKFFVIQRKNNVIRFLDSNITSIANLEITLLVYTYNAYIYRLRPKI